MFCFPPFHTPLCVDLPFFLPPSTDAISNRTYSVETRWYLSLSLFLSLANDNICVRNFAKFAKNLIEDEKSCWENLPRECLLSREKLNEPWGKSVSLRYLIDNDVCECGSGYHRWMKIHDVCMGGWVWREWEYKSGVVWSECLRYFMAEERTNERDVCENSWARACGDEKTSVIGKKSSRELRGSSVTDYESWDRVWELNIRVS